MKKGIYTYYKERLIEIGGNNKCLYLRSAGKRGAYDIGRILEGRGEKVSEFLDFLFASKRFPFTLIGAREKKQLIENLDIQSALDKKTLDVSELIGDELTKATLKNDRIRREESNRAIEHEISKIKQLKRDVEEIEKETGRAELYVGYPFVFGTIHQGSAKTTVKAPLLLFPVKIDIPDESTVEISINEKEKIQLNRALIFAYAQSKKLNIDGLETEFDDMSAYPSVAAVIKYLDSFHIRFDGTEYESKNVYNFGRFKEPDGKITLSIRYAAIMTRYSLSSSIFNDYGILEKKKLTNDAIEELLRPTRKKNSNKKPKIKAHKKGALAGSFNVKMPDYAQSEVVRRVDECGNMVIWGPPGTGKSQTIVNVITDAMAKGKRVLVVSQKKAALDVVYNRLGALCEKAMYITDETKEKAAFYDRCLSAHQKAVVLALESADKAKSDFLELESKIAEQMAVLDSIASLLNDKRPFGLSLSEMYNSSTMLQKNSTEYAIYTKLCAYDEIMSLTYAQLKDALHDIKAKNLEELYYNYVQEKEKNPIIDLMRSDVDTITLCEVKGALSEMMKSRRAPFNIAKYPYYRQVLAYYYQLDNKKVLASAVRLAKRFSKESRDEIKERFAETKAAIESYAKDYAFLKKVLTDDGYLAVIDNVLRANTSYLKFVFEALDNYINLRDVSKLLLGLDKNKTAILSFAYAISKNYQNYADIISKILELRIYHETVKYEDECKEKLAKILDFRNVTSRIVRYKEEQLSLSVKICEAASAKKYDKLYESSADNKDYLYQISKKQKFWPIRKTMEAFGEYILSLFPCWLLSPENVSVLLPLTKNLFDLVIFDEASQVFIESTIPSIYRGKNIVVAGDSKQLRPSTVFMKRYLGADIETIEDYSVQAALEVESLLDLAVARYQSTNLTYHYRSKSAELINFSNRAFYDMKLEVSPNTSKNSDSCPIERYKVAGKWIDRKNIPEAKKVVDILRGIFLTRKNNESIGIITFNADQQTAIADMIDKECSKDPTFRSYMLKERARTDGGEDTSIFIKNLENVQGDERDIIIFSIGYAENELGRIYTNFGSLSAEGGENRLNVAITRARSKIIVVTSIEPEDLKVDLTKNEGPKLLKTYLSYVRAVASRNQQEAEAVLATLSAPDTGAGDFIRAVSIENDLKERLEKLGYAVELGLGNAKNRISLAVYDPELDRYLVGVVLDSDAFASSNSSMERDVSKPGFLESRGWNLVRVWSRDFWISPQKVARSIASEAERAKKKLLKTNF
ncbi:MAG: DUF4011 domain-containing protein [Clostridia bacterium]|nr:DUF4011 domain-containing protein [Clostridia bacterium]